MYWQRSIRCQSSTLNTFRAQSDCWQLASLTSLASGSSFAVKELAHLVYKRVMDDVQTMLPDDFHCRLIAGSVLPIL